MAYESEIEKLRRRYDEKPEQWFAALADAHRKAGDLEQAIRIVEEGIKQRPNYVSGHIVLGRCLVDQGADDRAEKVFEEVLELDAENIIALKVLGDVSERRGDPEAARRWLARLLEVDPMNDEAREMLERVSDAAPEVSEVISPANPEAPIVTESAARAAGLSTHRSTPEDEGAEPSSEATPSDQPEVGSPTVSEAHSGDPSEVTEFLDSELEGVESVADERPAGGGEAADLVIERASEAIPSDDPTALEVDTFETLSESETTVVAFDSMTSGGASDDEATSSNGEPGPADLAAGTLDFGPKASDEEPIDLEIDAEAPAPPPEVVPIEEIQSAFAATEPVEPDAEQPVESSSQSLEVLGQNGQREEEDELPEDVASIFSSSAPISQFTDSAEVVDEPEVESSPSPADIETDFIPVDIEPPPSDAEVVATTDTVEVEPEEAEPVTVSDDYGTDESVVEEVAPTDEAGSDAGVDAAIVGSITAPEPEAPPASPLVTETMAEVYASQGHFDEARDVYRQLIADSPGDEGLQSRLDALEERVRAATDRGEEETQRQFAASETGGESVRSMLEGLLSSETGRADVASDEEVVFVTPSEPSPLEEAFGESGIPAGEPTRPATDSGPSLASVFGDDAALEDVPSEPPPTPEPSNELSYDGFYGSSDLTAAASDEPASENDDDEDFKSWLQSLKS